MVVNVVKQTSQPTGFLSPAVLRPPSASAYLGVSRSFLYLLVEREEFPMIKLGSRASGVLRSDLDAWLDRQRTAAIAN